MIGNDQRAVWSWRPQARSPPINLTGPGDDPGGQRFWTVQGEPLQGLVWRAQPELRHHPEGVLGPWTEIERECEKRG